MEKLTEDKIAALPVTEQERKSNEAFAKLASIIKHYNDGWEPSKGDLGYFVYSKSLLLLWGGISYPTAFSYSYASIGARLTIKDYDLTQFMIKNYEQLYKELWMEE